MVWSPEGRSPKCSCAASQPSLRPSRLSSWLPSEGQRLRTSTRCSRRCPAIRPVQWMPCWMSTTCRWRKSHPGFGNTWPRCVAPSDKALSRQLKRSRGRPASQSGSASAEGIQGQRPGGYLRWNPCDFGCLQCCRQHTVERCMVAACIPREKEPSAPDQPIRYSVTRMAVILRGRSSREPFFRRTCHRGLGDPAPAERSRTAPISGRRPRSAEGPPGDRSAQVDGVRGGHVLRKAQSGFRPIAAPNGAPVRRCIAELLPCAGERSIAAPQEENVLRRVTSIRTNDQIPECASRYRSWFVRCLASVAIARMWCSNVNS